MKRPNILILYTDQQRWDALGAAGNAEIHTPNLDRLAARGASFSRHFVQGAVCMPSRVSMLSGRYPSTLGITHMGVPVSEDLVTLPHLLGAVWLSQRQYRQAALPAARQPRPPFAASELWLRPPGNR